MRLQSQSAVSRLVRMKPVGVLLLAVCMYATGSLPSADALTLNRTVPCSESISQSRFPHLVNDPRFRYRLALDVLLVPPAYMKHVAPSRDELWPYWRKQGLVVRAGARTITITVPRAWQSQAAIAWGYGGKGEPFQTLRIAGCPGDPNLGNAYSGGFFLRSRSACVPLTFSVAGRSATVRFGIGMKCPQ